MKIQVLLGPMDGDVVNKRKPPPRVYYNLASSYTHKITEDDITAPGFIETYYKLMMIKGKLTYVWEESNLAKRGKGGKGATTA